MSEVIAKAKKKAQQIADDQALADDFSRVPKIQRKQRESDSEITSLEIRNVMADSFERLWDELSATKGFQNEDHIRVNAEEAARYITGSLVYGLHGHGPAVRIREQESTPRLCREHNG